MRKFLRQFPFDVKNIQCFPPTRTTRLEGEGRADDDVCRNRNVQRRRKIKSTLKIKIILFRREKGRHGFGPIARNPSEQIPNSVLESL